ncbi:hypothetical protein V496_00988 [Pseudogymnoascus sp. VKM F-4515 (FW-2607)]|nr:hypothetical protein V496_00988 [Pseudogymnoascus sp. VKM F-4515 (FW-2607)]
MATVNMNCVEFYNPNPKPALKAAHAQLTKSVLNKHQLPLQPSRSPPAMSAGDVQGNDSLDDSLPSLEELLRPPQNRHIAQVPHENHQPLHISKRELMDEGRLLTNATTPNPAYVPGNTQREPLIIEDDSDNESDDEAEIGVASSNLLASIEDQDASENGLATQDTASTPSSLFGPSTPRDSEYLNAGCFSKNGQQRLSFAELDSTFPAYVRRPSPSCSELAETTGHDQIHQDVKKAIVDEMRPFPLHERAGRSCDRGSVYDIEGELRQTSAEARGSPPLSAAHSQYNQMDQESQNNTEVRVISSEERLWEKTIEQQHYQQKEQEDEDEDDIEATSGEDKGPIGYCQQIKESLQNQRVEDETIVVAPLSQYREHSIKSYHKDNEDNEDNEDDEDEDVRPPRRRKRRHMESDATGIATRKKAHTRSSTIAQAQTCNTRGPTVSLSSPADAESTLGADYQEYPLQGFLKCVRIGRETTYNLEFRLLDLPDSFRPSIGLHISNSTPSGESVGGSARPRVCASHAKRSPPPAPQKQRKRPPLRERIVSRPGRHSTYSEDDDKLLIQLKEDDKLSWDEIAEYFPERTKGSLQVHYTTKLKYRSQTSKYKKRQITNSAKESGERYLSRFSMDLLDPQLQGALPSSTSILPATADSTEDAHEIILSTTPRTIESTEVQPLRSSQGVESNLVAVDATEGRWEVEALLAKSKVGNVIWYLVKWAGFRDEDNTWQKRDDISSDLINDFEASYRGNCLGNVYFACVTQTGFVRRVSAVDSPGSIAGSFSFRKATPAPPFVRPKDEMLAFQSHIREMERPPSKQKPRINDTGISTLHDPKEAVADIIFVHGLQGHPRKTWTYKGTASLRPGLRAQYARAGAQCIYSGNADLRRKVSV